MTPMLDAAIGLRWEETWCCDRFRTALDLGWEHHVLFNQNHRMKTNGGEVVLAEASRFASYTEEMGDIALGGFVLRLAFDF